MRHKMSSGERYSRLLTLFQVPHEKGKRTAWMCQCDCGVQKVISATALRSGTTASCGCFKLERIRETKTKHGSSRRGARTPEYKCWTQMIKRCSAPAGTEAFKNYAERGIRVCERWRNSFLAFLADMGEKPDNSYSIERLDVNGNYEPSNCVWATAETQRNNKRTSHRISVGGASLTIAQASESAADGASTLNWRINKGWAVDEALTRPASPLRSESSAQKRASAPLMKQLPPRRIV